MYLKFYSLPLILLFIFGKYSHTNQSIKGFTFFLNAENISSIRVKKIISDYSIYNMFLLAKFSFLPHK